MKDEINLLRLGDLNSLSYNMHFLKANFTNLGILEVLFMYINIFECVL